MILLFMTVVVVVCVSKGEMARLRLQAGCCMLKLAQEPVYADAIRLDQFQTMALLASVSNLHCLYASQLQLVQLLLPFSVFDYYLCLLQVEVKTFWETWRLFSGIYYMLNVSQHSQVFKKQTTYTAEAGCMLRT